MVGKGLGAWWPGIKEVTLLGNAGDLCSGLPTRRALALATILGPGQLWGPGHLDLGDRLA